MTGAARHARRALVALALLLPALWPAGAAAHAQLQSTTPAQDARLADAPQQVEFRFSESVTASAGALQVYDATGRTVQRGDPFHPGGAGAAIAVRLPAGLPDGGYTAVYRVISADSHPVSGGFSFRVGTGGAAARTPLSLLSGTEAGPVTSTALGVARGLQYTAIAVALGALLALWLCWLPALRDVAGATEPWRAASVAFADGTARVWTITAGVGVFAGLAGIGLEAAVAAGTSLWATDGPAIADVLGTRFGVTWGAGVLAWLVVGGLVRGRVAAPAALRPASLGATGLALPRAGRWPVGVPLLLLVLLPAFGGHAASTDPVAVMLPANLLHVLAVSAWGGGLVVLALLLGRAARRLDVGDRPALLRAVMGRFSRMALVAVGVVLASGVAQSLVNLSAFGQLLDTAYGRAVLIKLVLFAVLLGFGAVQRRRILPALGRGAPLGRALAAEVAVLAAVFGVTGALATYPPGDAVAAADPAGPFQDTRTLGPARARLTVAPASVGPNGLTIEFTDRRTGQPWRVPREVRVTAERPAAGIELPVPVSTNGEGRWTASGLVLPTAGRWRIEIAARVSDFDEYDAAFTVRVR